MLLNLSLVIIIFCLPNYCCSKQAAIFSVYSSHNEVELNNLGNLVEYGKQPLISCLHKCILVKNCSIVVYELFHSCIIIMKKNHVKDKKHFILYLKKSKLFKNLN